MVYLINGFVIPRDASQQRSLDRIKFSDIVCINGDLNPELEKKIKSYKQDIKIFYSTYHLLNKIILKIKIILYFLE